MRSRSVSVFTVDGRTGLADSSPPATTPDDSGLDWVAFSRFKHGAVEPAWRFAKQMAGTLAAANPETVFAERLVVTASCYKYLPLASVTLARTLAYLVNRLREPAGVPPVVVTQIYRDQLIEGDYSTMSLAQRRSFIDGDVILVDPEVLADAEVLVVDDVRITGFHEERITGLLEKSGVSDVLFAYWTIVVGCADPTLERRLNCSAIGDLDALTALIATGDFVLNSRVCKSILASPAEQLPGYLDRLPRSVLGELVAGMEGNGYAIMPTYRPAYQLMLDALRARAGGEAA